jgi:putative FmdB family regulatory protein
VPLSDYILDKKGYESLYYKRSKKIRRMMKMPLYEYRCDSCGNQFELRQKFSDPLASECPSCGGPVQKLISQTGFSLKGDGWFGDGYGSSKNAAPAPACPSGGSCAGCPSAAA